MVTDLEDVDDEGDDEQDAHNRPDEVASSHVSPSLVKACNTPEPVDRNVWGGMSRVVNAGRGRVSARSSPFGS